MTIEIPLLEEVITPGEYEEVEELLKRMYPGDRKPVEIELPRGKFVVFEAISAALFALTAAFLAGHLIEAIRSTPTDVERRRRRTQICVGECLAILEAVKLDVQDGYFQNRGLETSDDERRTRRKFKSRA